MGRKALTVTNLNNKIKHLQSCLEKLELSNMGNVEIQTKDADLIGDIDFTLTVHSDNIPYNNNLAIKEVTVTFDLSIKQ